MTHDSAEMPPFRTDAAIVGAGAAGMAAALFLTSCRQGTGVALLDGARSLGSKILISGGGRCNLTNRVVEAADFHGSRRADIAAVLKALPVREALTLFDDLGVPTHEEDHGKVFPDTNRSSDVVGALLSAVRSRSVVLVTGARIARIDTGTGGFDLLADEGRHVGTCRALLLATGGRSLPRTGSDAGGYLLAARLGHSIVLPVPALVPLRLAGSFHRPLTGVSLDVVLTVTADTLAPASTQGALLFTHHGISGPAVLDISRHWTRAAAERLSPRLTANLLPGRTFESVDHDLLAAAVAQPRARLQTWLAGHVPASVARAVLAAAGVVGSTTLAHLAKSSRRSVVRHLIELPLPVDGARGWDHAEVTAGGVPLDEIRPQTMESRRVPGLFFAGEIVDVDGRLGGFNFQWAWASARVAAAGIAGFLEASRYRDPEE